MIKEGDIDPLQGIFQGLCKVLIGYAWKGVPAGVVMGHDHSAGIPG